MDCLGERRNEFYDACLKETIVNICGAFSMANTHIQRNFSFLCVLFSKPNGLKCLMIQTS
jgi:hypothetical protein